MATTPIVTVAEGPVIKVDEWTSVHHRIVEIPTRKGLSRRLDVRIYLEDSPRWDGNGTYTGWTKDGFQRELGDEEAKALIAQWVKIDPAKPARVVKTTPAAPRVRKSRAKASV